MPDRSRPADPHRLIDAAMRLAIELDRARLYTAAAFAGMAADAIRESLRAPGGVHRTPLRTRRYFNCPRPSLMG